MTRPAAKRHICAVEPFVLTLWKCSFAGNHSEKKRMGRVAGNMPWASVTRRPWVPTTLWYRLSPGWRRKWHRNYCLSSPPTSPPPPRLNLLSPRMQLGLPKGFQIGKPSLFCLACCPDWRPRHPAQAKAVKDGRNPPHLRPPPPHGVESGTAGRTLCS